MSAPWQFTLLPLCTRSTHHRPAAKCFLLHLLPAAAALISANLGGASSYHRLDFCAVRSSPALEQSIIAVCLYQVLRAKKWIYCYFLLWGNRKTWWVWLQAARSTSNTFIIQCCYLRDPRFLADLLISPLISTSGKSETLSHSHTLTLFC